MKGDSLLLIITLLLLLSLIAPTVTAKPVQIGQIYSNDSGGINVYLAVKDDLKDKIVINLADYLERISQMSVLDIYAQKSDFFESIKQQQEAFLEGRAAIMLGEKSEKAILAEEGKHILPKGKSKIWKYLNTNQILVSIWFANQEFIFTNISMDTLMKRIKQNEKLNLNESIIDDNQKIMLFSLGKENYTLLSLESADYGQGVYIRVIRDEEKDREILNLITNSLSGLDDSRKRPSLFR